MPFSTARHYWHKVIGLTVLVLLVGCSGAKQMPVSVGEDEAAAELAELFSDEGDIVAEELGDEMVDPFAEEESSVTPIIEEFTEDLDQPFLLLPTLEDAITVHEWEVISGGLIGNRITGVVMEQLRQPVAVAARSEYVYIVDLGLNAVLRHDRATGRLEAILDLRSHVKGDVEDIYVAEDFSFYLTDTDGGRVLQFDRNGRLIQVFRNFNNLTKPVAIAVFPNGDVVIADGHYDHLLRFNAIGTLIAAYGGRGSDASEFLNITTMAQGPDGYYVGARIGRKIQVLAENGDYSYSFEEGKVIFPAAIVVDSENRSYVSDFMDNYIRVFDRGRLIARIGGAGGAVGKFMRIEDLWLDGQFLYVVDGLNRRVQVARLAPEGDIELDIEPAPLP